MRRRQAGSTLKPFLYGLALERRLLTPASLLEDAPLEIGVGAGLYRPENYDDRFRGLVSVRTALAASLNTPAVRALGLVGGDAFLDRLRALGFDGLRRGRRVLRPVARARLRRRQPLGAGRARTARWPLADALAPLRLTPDAAPPDRRVLDPAAAFLVADMLADRAGRSATFGLENPLATRFWSAVKTGTSTDMRDNWCVGFSRRFTVGVWVGNFSGEPMRDVSGVTGAAPVWLEMMDWLHRATSSEPPGPPAGIVATTVYVPRRRRAGLVPSGRSPAPRIPRRRSLPERPASARRWRARASRSIPTFRGSASAFGWTPRGPPRECGGA